MANEMQATPSSKGYHVVSANAQMKGIALTGSQRSGTTLLQTLLQSVLRDCARLGEVPSFGYAMTGIAQQAKHPQKAAYLFPKSDDAIELGRQVVGIFLKQVSLLQPASTVAVLKDPRLMQELDFVAAVFGSTRTVVCIRDPLDIIASFIKIGDRDRALGNAASRYAKRDLVFICEKVKRSLGMALNVASTEVCYVYYEDLVMDWRTTLQSLCIRMRLEYDVEGRVAWLPSELLHQQSWTSQLVGKPVDSSSVGSHLSTLTESEINLCLSHIGAIRCALGYESGEQRRNSSGHP